MIPPHRGVPGGAAGAGCGDELLYNFRIVDTIISIVEVLRKARSGSTRISGARLSHDGIITTTGAEMTDISQAKDAGQKAGKSAGSGGAVCRARLRAPRARDRRRRRRDAERAVCVDGSALPTIHRLLRTLVSLGYARQLPNRRYALGPRLIRIGEAHPVSSARSRAPS